MIGGFNTEGVDSGNSECAGDGSGLGVSLKSIGKVEEGEDIRSNCILRPEPVFECSASGGDGGVSSAGDDSEGVLDLSLIVVLGITGPDAALGDVEDVEDVLSVDVSSISVANLMVTGQAPAL